MRIIYSLLLFFILFISNISCIEETVNKANVENLKILRKSVNFAYNTGNYFLDLIRGSTPPHEPIQRYVNIFFARDTFKLTELISICLPFIGFISLTVLGLIFIILVPIVGFFFCCCRCAGKCGGKIRGMDTKHATCKRYTYALFLGIITIVQLAGIVLAFINNQLIHDTLTNPSEEISAIKQLSQGSKMLRMSLKNISEAIKDSENMLGNVNQELKGTNFMELTCDQYLTMLKNDTDKLNIDSDLRQISSKLDATLNYINQVKKVNEKLNNYSSELKMQTFNLRVDNLRTQVCDMLSKVIKTDFEDLMSIILGQIKVDSSTGKKLRNIVNFFNGTIQKSIENILKNIDASFNVTILEYRMYVFIGICCLLLLIVLFYFLGLCFGQCGERPFEDARICNRGVGANLMMAGVAFAFFFTPIIMIFEISLFLSGGMVQTEVCRYLNNPIKPGVQSFDMSLQTIPTLKNNSYIKNNIFDIILNKCPSQSMAIAFNIDKDSMPQEVINKIGEISSKVRMEPKESKDRIVAGYFSEIEGLLSKISDEISDEISKNNGDYDSLDDGMKQVIVDKLMFLSTEINIFLSSKVKEKFIKSFDNAANLGLTPTLMNKSKDLISAIYLSSYRDVKCDGLSKSAVIIIDSVCVTFLWPFNGFWYGVGICLVFTIPAIIFAVKLAGLYRRTEKYSSDYEEPDYNSYIGFYSNNTENIPMKGPKSAKSNGKNRSSNSNNKDSLKQNNPQYLPVYPYDAYE